MLYVQFMEKKYFPVGCNVLYIIFILIAPASLEWCGLSLVGTIVQCSGEAQNGNDILQEKFQACSDNHFYRIKS